MRKRERDRQKCEEERDRGSSTNIASLSESIRAGKSLMPTPSSVSACLSVKDQGSSPAVADVRFDYIITLDCLASRTFLPYTSLHALKASYKPVLKLHDLERNFPFRLFFSI